MDGTIRGGWWKSVCCIFSFSMLACVGDIGGERERSETSTFVAVGDEATRRPFPASFGVAHARPRYNPHGAIETAFVDGAVDAYNLGIQTLKIWVGPEIRDPSFYFLGPENLARFTDFSSVLDMAPYQEVLALPFKTVVITADDSVLWNMANRPLEEEELQRIYQTTFDFARELRQRYSGSGRTFLLQNHEGDWHIDPTGVPNANNNPSATGLRNFELYWQTRQRAIEDARAAQPSDVAVYHLCEVVRVLPSLQGNAPSLARDVLPKVACDLVGYSAYESSLQSNQVFEQALAYLRSVSLVSPTFGSNQVVVSEIGLPEQRPGYTNADKAEMAQLIVSLVQRGMPYVLFWTLYDNECSLPACAQPGGITSNVALQDLSGFYVRKPDGSLGEIFTRVRDALVGRPTASFDLYLRRLYEMVLRRSSASLEGPGFQQGLLYWRGLYESGQIQGCIALTRALLLSQEGQRLQDALSVPDFVAYLYQAAFGRDGDRAGEEYWSGKILGGTLTRSGLAEFFLAHASVVDRCQQAGLRP